MLTLVKYPNKAKKEGIEGAVLLTVKIGVDGKILDVVILNSSNTFFNQSAIDAVYEYDLFVPAIKNNCPADGEVTIPINYILD